MVPKEIREKDLSLVSFLPAASADVSAKPASQGMFSQDLTSLFCEHHEVHGEEAASEYRFLFYLKSPRFLYSLISHSVFANLLKDVG